MVLFSFNTTDTNTTQPTVNTNTAGKTLKYLPSQYSTHGTLLTQHNQHKHNTNTTQPTLNANTAGKTLKFLPSEYSTHGTLLTQHNRHKHSTTNTQHKHSRKNINNFAI